MDLSARQDHCPPGDHGATADLCRRFAEAWENGQRPRIEDYLSSPHASPPADLLRWLIEVDMHYRRRHGEDPRPEEYAHRFPSADGHLIASANVTRSLAGSLAAGEPGAGHEATAHATVHELRCPHCHNPLPHAPAQGDAVLCPACGSSCRVTPVVPGSTIAEVRILGRFQLMDHVGHGAFGAVWRARDCQLDRIVAVKIPHASVLSKGDSLQRFEREARSAAQLRHPGIVRLYEAAVIEGTPILVSDFIEGVPLKEYLEVRRLTTREAAGLVAEVADALHYAHTMGLVHRDIKPGNIMLERPGAAPTSASAATLGKPVIVDFGLALREEAEIVMTMEGQIIGTPAYMSPEQASGKSHTVDGRSDIYSLGVVLYELICGELPFRGSKAMILNQVLTEEPRPPRRINDHIPRDLETICLKALAKQPGRRYATAGEFAADLRRLLRGEAIHARPIGTPERLWRWCRRNPLVASLSGTIAVVLLVGILVAWHFALEAAQGERDAIRHARRADDAATAAEASRRREQQERILSDHRYYAAEISRAHAHWLQGQIAFVEQRLQALRPRRDDDADLRSFEWFFLKRVCHAELRTLVGHGGTVWHVCCSPDGNQAASAENDGTIRRWDIATGQEVQRRQAHRGQVWSLAYSPDGKSLASIGADRTLKLWGLDADQLLWSAEIEQGQWTSGLAFSPDGRQLAVPVDPQTIQVRDVRTGKESLKVRMPGPAPRPCVAFSPDGGRLASVSNSTVYVWDAHSGKPLFTIPTPQPLFTIAFSPDGRRLASAGLSPAVRVWDAATGQEVMTLTGHHAVVEDVAFSPDSRRLATASEDRTVKIWDLGTGAELQTLRGHGAEVLTVTFDRTGFRVLSGSADGTIRIWETVSEPDCRTLAGTTAPVWSIAFSPDGTRLASSGSDSTVRIWNVHTELEEACLYAHNANFCQVVFSPDGRWLASASGTHTWHNSQFPGDIEIWDRGAGGEPRVIRSPGGGVQAVAFSSDDRLASGDEDGAVRFWNPRTGALLTTIHAHAGPVQDVVFSPDGKSFATCCKDPQGSSSEVVRLWDAVDGRELIRVAPAPGLIHHLAFSHDSRLLAGAGQDQRIHIWDTHTGDERPPLHGHTKAVYKVAFSPDDRRIVSAGLDHTCKVWDVLTGMEMMSIPAHDDAVLDVAFCPHALCFASCGNDRSIKLWDATLPTPDDLVQREALSLVRFLFKQDSSADNVAARIRTATGITDAVRRRALSLAEAYGKNLRHQEAFEYVSRALALHEPKQDILASIRRDRRISARLRRDAVQLVEQYPEDIGLMHWHSRVVADRQDQTAAEYRLALRQAEAACQAEPGNAEYVTTLGMAQYREKLFAGARTNLLRAASMDGSRINPVNLAFQAMVSFRLGQVQKAREQLHDLERLRRDRKQAPDDESAQCMREAKNLIE